MTPNPTLVLAQAILDFLKTHEIPHADLGEALRIARKLVKDRVSPEQNAKLLEQFGVEMAASDY